MNDLRRLIVFLVAIAVLANAGPSTAGRPRIGLVLEGGGALGCAHIGALEVLEEQRIPIDFIAGTSIGAIVGGLYAAGMSPAEIEENLAAINWEDMFTDRPERTQVSYRRKEDDGRYLKDLQLGMKRGRLITPTGLIMGQKLGFLLASLTMRASEVANFDSLGVPFRAVATDIVTGETVVLDHGDLADAMRASMSVPGVFSPVEIDGRLLVDGGLTANLPVDVVRKIGADVVIAVDIGSPLAGRREVRSAIGVSMQVIGLLTRGNTEAQIARADIVIRPDLAGLSGLRFDRAPEIVQRGAAATRLAADSLAPFVLDEAEYGAYLKRIRRGPPGAIPIAFVRIDGRSRVDPRRIAGRLDSRPGRDLDMGVLQDDLARAYDIGEFERVEFRLSRSDERTGLSFRTKDKYWGPDYVRFGLNFMDDLEGRGQYNLLAGYTRTCIGARGGEWRVDLQTGRTGRIFTEFYQPLDFGERLFAAPSFEGKNAIRDLYAGGRRIAEYRTISLLGGADLGMRIGTIGEARIGARWGRSRTSIESGGEELPAYDVHRGEFSGRVVIDRIDNVGFPRSGASIRIDFRLPRKSIGATASYEKLSSEVSVHRSFGNSTFSLGGGGGTNLGTRLPPHDEFSLGGIFSLSGYRDGELSGQYYGLARAGFQRRAGRLPPIAGSYFYFRAWIEAGNVWQTRSDIGAAHLRATGTLALGADTILGPFIFAHGRAEGGRGRFYVSLGRGF